MEFKFFLAALVPLQLTEVAFFQKPRPIPSGRGFYFFAATTIWSLARNSRWLAQNFLWLGVLNSL